MGFSGAGIKGDSVDDCSSKCCPISAVSPLPTTNVVPDNNGHHVKHVYDDFIKQIYLLKIALSVFIN